MTKSAILPLLIITTIFIKGCTHKTSTENIEDNRSAIDKKESEAKETDNARDQQAELNIDGSYSGTQNISGLELTATLTITGNRWSATSQLGYDNPEFQNGTVKGTDLYDQSGMIKIGNVSGNIARIDGYPRMRR